MMLAPVRTTPPATPLVSLVEAKAHLRVDHGDDDTLIEGLVAAATAWLDGYSGVLGRALINQTWRVNLCSWPARRVRLPLAPVSAVTSVKYWDTANAQQTLDAANWVGPLEDALSPYVGWMPDASLPSLYEREDAIEVLFVAGYGEDASDVPASIRHAALMLIGHWYEVRETVNVGNITSELPFTVAALIAPFRRVGV